MGAGAMSRVVTLDLTGWRPVLTPDARQTCIQALEEGGVLLLPHVNFTLAEAETKLLSPDISDGRAKNISLDGDALKGARGNAEAGGLLPAMSGGYARLGSELVPSLFPLYAPYVPRARTSYRPHPAVGRDVSWRKDDSRL